MTPQTSVLRMLTMSTVLSSVLWLSHAPAWADAVVRKAVAAGPGHIAMDAPNEWRDLTAEQQKVLQPLAPHWATLDDATRAKWVNLATRFKKLTPAEQSRVQARMDQWSKLKPQERGEARLRFQQTRQLTPDERQQKWAAYQALSPEARQDLKRQAQRKAKPVYLADGMTGPREARQAFASSQRHASNGGTSEKKTNLVPNAMLGTAPAPTVVAPTLVKAGSGATTNLVTQRPVPPMHQHTGLPKIAASKGFVDPVTLLPRKGAQSAAMASLPAAGLPDRPPAR